MIRKQFVLLAILLGLLSLSLPAMASRVDSLVSYQGQLQGSDGNPIPDGFHAIIFSLYTQSAGGTPIWTEMQDVSTSGGLFSLMLGSHTPFALSMFDNDSLYLSTQVAGGTELSPRLRIGTVPFAAVSSRLNGDAVTQPGSLDVCSPNRVWCFGVKVTDNSAGIAIDEPGAHFAQMVTPDSTVFDQGSETNNRIMIHKIHAGENRMAQMIYPDSLVAEQVAHIHTANIIHRDLATRNLLSSSRQFSDGSLINEVDEDCDGISAKHAINTKGTGGTRTMSVSSITDEQSASSVCGGDLDGDGVPDVSVSNSITPTMAGMAIKTKGTGADKNRVVAACSTGTDGMASVDCDHDSDGDGVPESSIKFQARSKQSEVKANTKSAYTAQRASFSADSVSGTIECAMDVDNDGVMDNEATDVVDVAGARRRLAVHNLGSSGQDGVDIQLGQVTRRLEVSNIGSSGQDGVEVNMRCRADSLVESKNVRKNGALIAADYDYKDHSRNSRISSFFDVFTEMSIEDVCDATGATRRLSTHNLGSSGQDGVSMSARPGGSSSIRCDNDSDGDGIPDAEVSQSVTPTTAGVAIKTKGTGADANRTMSASTSTDAASATILLEADTDGDGIPESSLRESSAPSISEIVVTKRTGAKRLSAGGDCDDADASLHVDCDDNNDGVMDRSVSSSVDDSASVVSASQGGLSVRLGTRKGWDGTIKGNMRVSSGSTDVIDLDSDGDGYFAGKVGIGVATPTHSIDVAGGAYCNGSNWVNASDANLKENFSEVNGEALLSKINELTVSEWNYKNDNQSVKHIGPTAQDFQKTFGVGSDGKSISTIDPSGIALAAIKELNKQNQELKDQNSELQKRLDDIQKKVDRLISRQ